MDDLPSLRTQAPQKSAVVPEPLVLTSPPETKKNRRTLHPVPNFVDPLVTR